MNQKSLFDAIEEISKNYELFVANGGSIHEYSGYKGRALNYAHLANKYGDEEAIKKANDSIFKFAKYVGERINK